MPTGFDECFEGLWRPRRSRLARSSTGGLPGRGGPSATGAAAARRSDRPAQRQRTRRPVPLMQPFRLCRRRCERPRRQRRVLAIRTRSPSVAEPRSQACVDRLHAMPAPAAARLRQSPPNGPCALRRPRRYPAIDDLRGMPGARYARLREELTECARLHRPQPPSRHRPAAASAEAANRHRYARDTAEHAYGACNAAPATRAATDAGATPQPATGPGPESPVATGA